MPRVALLCCFLVLFIISLTNASLCSSSSAVGSICQISAYDVKPTQFAIGKLEASCKTGYLESLSSSDLQHFLSKFVINFFSPLLDINNIYQTFKLFTMRDRPSEAWYLYHGPPSLGSSFVQR